jgi:hypothetical protein
VKRLIVAAFAGAFAGAFAACSSSDGGTVALGSDASTDSGAIEDAGQPEVQANDGPTDFCNELNQLGTPQDIVSSSQPQPAPKGGVVLEGTYIGAGAIAYTTLFPDGSKLAQLAPVTLEIKGDQVRELTSYTHFQQDRSRGTFATSGTNLTITQTCHYPVGDGGLPAPTGYTASGGDLSLFTIVNGIPAELKLTKMP